MAGGDPGGDVGGKGAVEFATMVCDILSTTESHYHPLYDRHEPVKEKIEKIAKQIYAAKGVHYSDLAERKLKLIHELGLDEAYVCMAKTPNSLSDNAKLLGVPTDFEIDVRDIDFAAGANFIIPLCGSILTMPGLPKVPAAVKMEDDPW